MPRLDVSELLTDPDFMTTFIRRRRTETIGANGRGVLTSSDKRCRGVITAGGGDRLDRLPEGTRVSGSIFIYTREQLQQNTDTTAADEIVWKNQEYIVSSLSDYSEFGRGFWFAIGTLKPFVDPS